MTRSMTRATFVVTLLVSAACTQQPASVALKGHNLYGKSGARYVSSPSHAYSPPEYTAPISYETNQDVAVSSIEVSELGAPDTPKKPSIVESKPIAMKPGVKSEAKTQPIQKVNPWTKKPRAEFVEQPKEQPKADKTPEKISAKTSKKPILSQRSAPVVIQKAQISPLSSREHASFIWPVNGNKIVSNYGPKGGGKVNDGINIAAADGEPVWAAADGEVVYVGNELEGYGNMVLIKHSGSKTTTYAHLNRATIDKYDRVKQGDIIGYVGETGNVKKPQLHFAIRDGKDFVDPQKYLSRSLAGL